MNDHLDSGSYPNPNYGVLDESQKVFDITRHHGGMLLKIDAHHNAVRIQFRDTLMLIADSASPDVACAIEAVDNSELWIVNATLFIRENLGKMLKDQSGRLWNVEQGSRSLKPGEGRLTGTIEGMPLAKDLRFTGSGSSDGIALNAV